MYQNILTAVDRGVGIITLNRPERHNAFDDVLIGELIDAVAMMEHEDAVRVLVISSTGKSFCAGADLNWMKRAAGLSAEDSLRESRAMAEMLCCLAQMGKPTVARVQGHAYGGGVGLVAACDIAIATFDAQFTLSEVKLGIIPAVISPHVIAAIGERYARRYMLSAERFAAAEAYRIGLLHEIVPDEEALDEAIGEIVETLLKNSPNALKECKELIRAVVSRPLTQEVVEDTAQRICRLRASDQGKEGMSAFLEKRKPNWVIE
ncbi:MAG: enoyl-CoA hydratase/isomerase family protein [Rhodocyclaceae bacterium]|nr:MAG: enoyl-CoA hydratase/isomerase family protein [Rhodocyclaceae bacterium]